MVDPRLLREAGACWFSVSARRADIMRELEADVPWTLGERPFATCMPEMNQPVRGTFATTRDAAPMEHPDTSLQLVLDGRLQTFERVRVSAGRPTREDGTREPTSLTFVGRRADGGSALVRFDLNGAIPSEPRTIALHGFESSGSVYTWKGESRSRFVGYIGKGQIAFAQASGEPGSPISGRFEATFLQTQPSKLDEATTPGREDVPTDVAIVAEPADP